MTDNDIIKEIFHQVYNIWWLKYRRLDHAALDRAMEQAVKEAGEIMVRYKLHPVCSGLIYPLLDELDHRVNEKAAP